jgi:hypothetical protein
MALRTISFQPVHRFIATRATPGRPRGDPVDACPGQAGRRAGQHRVDPGILNRMHFRVVLYNFGWLAVSGLAMGLPIQSLPARCTTEYLVGLRPRNQRGRPVSKGGSSDASDEGKEVTPRMRATTPGDSPASTNATARRRRRSNSAALPSGLIPHAGQHPCRRRSLAAPSSVTPRAG